ncbi:hypothetical protein [Actinoplanes subtropicus]|uniref:hypothetical protein n=1 Tax=Actinoplanes subtropicus TaxID=543632 RepID=UPI0004C320D0|nr:hypothetical protein [Actinoplanes subtropicus]
MRGVPDAGRRPAWGHFFFLFFLSFFDFFDFFAMVGLPPTLSASRPALRDNGFRNARAAEPAAAVG